MGGANNRSFISAHFCISAYFLTAETYKRMRLTTRVYSMYNIHVHCIYAKVVNRESANRPLI